MPSSMISASIAIRASTTCCPRIGTTFWILPTRISSAPAGDVPARRSIGLQEKRPGGFFAQGRFRLQQLAIVGRRHNGRRGVDFLRESNFPFLAVTVTRAVPALAACNFSPTGAMTSFWNPGGRVISVRSRSWSASLMSNGSWRVSAPSGNQVGMKGRSK